MRLLQIAATCAIVAGCVVGPSSATAGLKLGTWGGQHATLKVTTDGAVVEFDCGHGTVGQAITLDDQNRFDAPGRYYGEGGPTREDNPGQAVRYTGRVSGESLVLRIVFASETSDDFALSYGAPGRLLKCL
jgi:hypothetical protein